MKYSYGKCKIEGLNPTILKDKGKVSGYKYRDFTILKSKKSYKEKYEIKGRYFRTLQDAFTFVDDKYIRAYPRLFHQTKDELINGVIDELKRT